MMTLVFAAALSFGVCFVLTPAVRSLAPRLGLVDRPDRFRKLHRRATPRAGGIGILVAISCGVGACLALPGPVREQLGVQGRQLLGLLLAAIIICLVGVVDDAVSLRGRYKLLGQAVAAAVLIASGLVVRNVRVFGCDVDLGLLAVPFTGLWLLGAINSLNLIDGMDGLLSSVGLIVSLALAALALLGSRWVPACVACALAGALLAFLRYNFPPASIFLGDCGSMLVGLVVGALAILGAMKGPATVALSAPLAILTVPFFDTFMAIVRRKLTGRSLYATDRGHLHHCLLRRGLSNRGALLIVALTSSLAAAGGLASLFLCNEFLAVVTTLAVVAIFVTTRLFGHAELRLATECLAAALPAWLLRRRAADGPREIQVRLQGCAGWEELWARLVRCAEQLQLSEVSLDVNAPALHEAYYASWRRPGCEPREAGSWQTEVPVSVLGQPAGRVRLAGLPDGTPCWDAMTIVAQVLDGFQPAFPAAPEAGDTAAARLEVAACTLEDAPEKDLLEADAPCPEGVA